MPRGIVAGLAAAIAGLALAAVVAVNTAPVIDDIEAGSTRGPCNAEAQRAHLVVREGCRAIPALRSRRLPRAEAANALRRWVASWVVVAADGTMLREEDYYKKHADELYRAFRGRELGVYCGGVAWALMKVYETFGFESWIYVFGLGDGSPLTHTVTLVKVGERLIVQDAYFNYTIANAEGGLMDFRDVVDAARRGRLERTTTIRTEPVSRLVLLQRAMPPALNELPDWLGGRAGQIDECRVVRTDVLECRANNVTALDAKSWDRWPEVASHLQERGLMAELPSLMVFPLGASSTADGWTEIADARPTGTARLLRELQRILGQP